MFIFRGRHAFWKQIVVLAALALAIYGASLGNGFVLDDGQQVVNNALTESLERLPTIFRGASNEADGDLKSYGVYFRPFMISSYALIRSAAGLRSEAFHSVQLLLHLVNAAMVLALLGSFVGQVPAFLGALIFLVHPMNGESVTYIAALQDPLYAIFGLAGLVWIAKRERWGWPDVGVSAVLFLCALLSKETGMLFALMAIPYGFFFRKKDGMKIAAAAVLAGGGYLFLRLGLAGLTTADHATTHIARAPLVERLMTVPAVLYSYLTKFVFPRALSTNQDWMVTSVQDPMLWGPLLFVVLVTVVCLREVQRRGWTSPFAFFFYWSLLGLGLHSQLLNPLDGTVSERWFYFPCMGLLGMTAVWLTGLKTVERNRTAVIAVVGLIAVIFSVQSFLRSRDWENDYTLAVRDTQTDPTSPFTFNNLGVELFKRGEFQNARPPLEKSIELNPHWNTSWNNLGAVHQQLGDLKKAEECFLRSMEYGPLVLAYRNYPMVLIQQGRRVEAKEFVLQKAIRYFPGDPQIQQLAKAL